MTGGYSATFNFGFVHSFDPAVSCLTYTNTIAGPTSMNTFNSFSDVTFAEVTSAITLTAYTTNSYDMNDAYPSPGSICSNPSYSVSTPTSPTD